METGTDRDLSLGARKEGYQTPVFSQQLGGGGGIDYDLVITCLNVFLPRFRISALGLGLPPYSSSVAKRLPNGSQSPRMVLIWPEGPLTTLGSTIFMPFVTGNPIYPEDT